VQISDIVLPVYRTVHTVNGALR